MIQDILEPHIITIIFLVFSTGGVYFLFQYKLGLAEKRLDKHDAKISELRKENIHMVEVRTNVKWIMQTVNEIKDQIRNLH